MSDHIYSQLFSESTSKPTFICQYVSCGAPLTANRKFCNLSCYNKQNALRQTQEAETRRATKQAAYAANPSKCLRCDQPINWDSYMTSKAKYCSNSCASTQTNLLRPQASRNKQRQSILKTFHNGELHDAAESKKSSRSNITLAELIESIQSFDQLFKHHTACLKIIHEGKVFINEQVEFMSHYGII